MPMFEAHQTVYDRSGAKYDYVEALANGRSLVRKIMVYTDYDGEEAHVPDDACVIIQTDQLSATPPRQAIDAEVAAAAAELKTLRAEIATAQFGLCDQERSAKARLAALQQYKPLERIEDFLVGRITHFMVIGANYTPSVKVMTFDQWMKCTDDGGGTNGDVKLLCLFGTSRVVHRKPKTLEWRTNHYYDGSGSWTRAEPHTCLEDAVQAATEHLISLWEGFRSEPKNRHTLGSTITSAKAIGLDVPADIQAAYDDFRSEAALGNVRRAAEALEKANADYVAQIGKPVPESVS